MKVNAKNLSAILAKTLPAGLPTLTIGQPGIGKSDIHMQAAKMAGMEYKVFYPAILDPVDLAGLPVPVGDSQHKRVQRLLDDNFEQLFGSKTPVLVMLDELGQASPAMQSAAAPLILSKELGGRKLPKHVTICAATNRKQDRAGAGNILTHIISRMATVLELEADLESWKNWALNNGISPYIISLFEFRPSLLQNYDAEKAYAYGESYPCPRSWANASNLINLNMDDESESIALCGCIGEGAAHELIAHLQLSRDRVDLNDILKHPDSFKIPSETSLRYAIACGIATRANEKTVEPIITLTERFFQSGMAEFSALLIRDSMVVYPGFANTPAFIKAANGSLGKTIREI